MEAVYKVICGTSIRYSLDYEMVMHLFPDKNIVFCENKEAEYSKYVHNAFAATKVNFFNAVYKYCQTNDLDYVTVRDNALITGFINEEHTNVPGHDGKFGYGGTCLPKDNKIFQGLMRGITAIPIVTTSENNAIRGEE